MTLASELSLPAVLQRIVQLAAEITGARYAALGVLGPGRWLIDFITEGVTADQRAAIGNLPQGHGILGLLIDEARPLRLIDLTQHPKSYGFPPNHPPMKSFLGAPVKGREEVYGNIYLTEKHGAAEFSAEDQEALEILAAQASIAIENARLHQEAVQRERRLAAVHEVASALLAGEEVEAVLRLAAGHARGLAGVDVAAVLTAAEGSAELQVRAVAGAPELEGFAFGCAGTAAEDVLASGQTRVEPDLTAIRAPIAGRAGLGPGALLPASVRGQRVGVLVLANRAGGKPVPKQQVTQAATLADQVAVVLEYTRAQTALRRLAVLGDRERIARELHDGAIQALFAIGLELQAGAALAADQELRGRLERVVDEVDRVIRELRGYIFALRPASLRGQGLAATLGELAEQAGQRTGLTVVTDIQPGIEGRLARRAGDVVQLTREALSNVTRHAHALTCRVTLRQEDRHALLEVDDDGRGFDPGAVSAGSGLRNIRARAAAFGGRAEITATPGEGATVRVWIPL